MDKVTAGKLNSKLDAAGLPDISAWERSQIVAFCSDWRSENPDPERETCVQMLWSPDSLFVRYQCRFRNLFVYEGSPGRRDKLWERDVAEIFVRPGRDEPTHYREFEISPSGDWLDLDIFPGGKSILYCNLKSRVEVDLPARIWTAEMAIPFSCLGTSFDPGETWRLNLFRIEGQGPDRFYSSWRPTHTPQPNFHVLEAFGYLHFE